MRKTIAVLIVFSLLAGAPGARAFAAGPATEALKREAKGAVIAPVVILGVGALAYFLTGCATVPLTGRKQFNMVPDGMMDGMGEDSWRQVRGENRAVRAGSEREMLERIARRVIAASGMEGGWEVELFDAPRTVNAFAIPGKKIGVFTGILPYTRDEAGLAAVIGHEVGHVMARHSAERMSQVLTLQVGLSVLDEALLQKKMQDPQTRALVLGALGAGAALGVVLPYSRMHESEADHIGIILMAKAGYDPHAAPELWRRMPGGGGSDFMSTHPSHERRISQLEGWMPEAMQYYQQTRQGVGVSR